MYLVIQLLDKQCFRNNHLPVSCRAECKVPVWAPLCRRVWSGLETGRIKCRDCEIYVADSAFMLLIAHL